MLFTIYSQPGCSFCEQAKALVKSKGFEYVELILNVGQKQEQGKHYVPVTQLKAKAPSAKSVPQIFIGSKHVGGFTDLEKYLKHERTIL